MTRSYMVLVAGVLLTQAACASASGAAESSEAAAPQPHRPDMAAQKSAMQRVGFLAGKWEGEGWVINGPNRFEFRQTENVRYNLDSQILLIDGRGYARTAPDGAPPSFSAFAVISFNDAKQEYEFRSYAYGYAGNYKAEFLDDGAFQWSAGPARYRIWLNDDGQWFETGERPDDAGNWTQFFEMTLSKVDE